MLDIQRILCPVDFSDVSRNALAHAATIGQWYGSSIRVLHVDKPELEANPPLPSAATVDAVMTLTARRPLLEERVRDTLLPAIHPHLATQVVVDEGNPASRILEHARTWPADLIVLATHGRTGVERLMLGSVAEKVLRKASCPVLTVPPPATMTSHLPFAHVLCPVDFSDSSLAALEFALSLAQESGARLTVMHVFEWPADETSARRTLETSEYHRQLEAETRQKLNALISDEVRQWCAPEPRLVFGKAHERILDVAAREGADLIVIGVHGRNALDLMLFGSTTNQVIRQASCPVLTLRH
jgi:nucleotide-binding universal stress UspA family protein